MKNIILICINIKTNSNMKKNFERILDSYFKGLSNIKVNKRNDGGVLYEIMHPENPILKAYIDLYSEKGKEFAMINAQIRVYNIENVPAFLHESFMFAFPEKPIFFPAIERKEKSEFLDIEGLSLNDGAIDARVYFEYDSATAMTNTSPNAKEVVYDVIQIISVVWRNIDITKSLYKNERDSIEKHFKAHKLNLEIIW